jgi:hypothetical protein
MNLSDARHLAHTGMLFVPSDSRMASTKPDVARIHREMAEALRTPPDSVPVPTVVVAPSTAFDQVWNAIVNNVWSDDLKTNYIALHQDGEIRFEKRT